MTTNIPPTGTGPNTNIQPPEDDKDKEQENSNNANDQHRPQTKFGKRLTGTSLADRARGIKQVDNSNGSIMRKNDSNNAPPSDQEQTAGGDDS